MGRVEEIGNVVFGADAFELIKDFGSPLYIYGENELRIRCRRLKSLFGHPRFKINYSAKANSNLYFLRVVKEEGLCLDAMSPGEIYAGFKAGFAPGNIFFISNNVSREEFVYALKAGVTISVDSISQLELLAGLNPGGGVSVRINPGIGAGHHEKVVTGGRFTKFGINMEYLPDILRISREYDLRVIGVNQHIGSLFMYPEPYIEAARALLLAAESFPDLEFIDFGGGFGIPYHKREGEGELDWKGLSAQLEILMIDFCKKYGRNVAFGIEPGRSVAAECGVLLGTVNAVKLNGANKYVGTDIGFNVFSRVVMYDAHHDLRVFSRNGTFGENEAVTVVGNICETGDYLAKDRLLPKTREGDLIGVMDAGAYSYSMSGNYNNRPRPAEVFIRETGQAVLTRKRDTMEDIMRNFIL